MNKRGISAIVATVLIVLITVAAIAIVWVSVVSVVQEDGFFEDLDIRLDIIVLKGHTVYDAKSGLLLVHVSRGADEENISEIDLVVTLNGNSVTARFPAPEANSERRYSFDLSAERDVGLIPISVRVAPIYFLNGKLTIGVASADVKIPIKPIVDAEKILGGEDVFVFENEDNELGGSCDYVGLEETQGWSESCKDYTGGYPGDPVVDCSNDFVTNDSIDKLCGDFSLVLKGSRTQETRYDTYLAVEPDTLYSLSFDLKIRNRRAYNYLNLDYPEGVSIVRGVGANKGIWSGLYDVQLNWRDILPSQFTASPFRSDSDVDWFREKYYFKTDADMISMPLRLSLTGFDGELVIDSIVLTEEESVIEDKYLHMPITTEFQGMRIKTVSQSPLSIETNAGFFRFSDDSIILEKDGETVSTISFDSDILSGLSATEEQGTVFLENSNVAISVGADSSLILRLVDGAVVSVSGPKPGYSNFEAGVIFATDYEKGIFFSPIRSAYEVSRFPRSYDSSANVWTYDDADFENAGMKFWNIESDFSTDWEIDYIFRAGGGFIVELFPPKDFDYSKSCNERFAPIYPDDTYVGGEYTRIGPILNQFDGFNKNIGLLPQTGTYLSDNDLSPPEYYCKDSGGDYVHCSEAGAIQYPLDKKADISGGPYRLWDSTFLNEFASEAHDTYDTRLVFYLSPQYYYTYDVDALLENVKDIMNEVPFDGVYYDGLYMHDVLKSLELARKTRNLLGDDEFYVQHYSLMHADAPYSHRFRNPVLDSYADLLWAGEGIKAVDDDIWRINLCGANVSNTVTQVLPELRPVDWDSSSFESGLLSLSAEEQFDMALKYDCKIRIRDEFGSVWFSDSKFGTGFSGDSRLFYEEFDSMCESL